MKILHLADSHAYEDNTEEAIRCLEVVEEAAIENKVDAVLHAGDMWHATVRNVRGSPLASVVRIMERIAERVPVVIIRGTPTHDVAGSLDVFKGHGNITVVEEGGVHTIGIPRRDVDMQIIIAAVPPFSQAVLAEKMREVREAMGEESAEVDLNDLTHSVVQDYFRAMRREMEDSDPGHKCPHIMLGHFEVLGSRISETQSLKSSDVKISAHDIDLAGVNCAMLGHIHFPQRFEDTNIFYSGSTVHLNYGEEYDVGFWIHEFEHSVLINSRFVKTPSAPKYMIKANITCQAELDFLKTKIADAPDGAKYKLNVSLSDELRGVIDQEGLLKLLEGKGALDTAVAIAYLPKDRTRIESEALGEAKALPDKFALYCEVNDEVATPRRLSLVSSMEHNEGTDELLSETFAEETIVVAPEVVSQDEIFETVIEVPVPEHNDGTVSGKIGEVKDVDGVEYGPSVITEALGANQETTTLDKMFKSVEDSFKETAAGDSGEKNPDELPRSLFN